MSEKIVQWRVQWGLSKMNMKHCEAALNDVSIAG